MERKERKKLIQLRKFLKNHIHFSQIYFWKKKKNWTTQEKKPREKNSSADKKKTHIQIRDKIDGVLNNEKIWKIPDTNESS